MNALHVLGNVLLTYGPWAIVAADAAAMALPKVIPGFPAWGFIRGILDTLAMNLGNSKNTA